jgi:mannosyltransferase
LPVVVTAFLGSWELLTPALWADELATWGAVRLSWEKLWELSGSIDAVLLPYYSLLKVLTGYFGTGDAALRVPSVVACSVAAFAVTAVGRRLGGAGAGLAGGLIFAVLPVTSRYAQEARPYAFAMLFGALSLWALLCLLERPRFLPALGYTAATLLAGLAHPLGGMLMVAAHGVAILARLPVARRGAWRATLWWFGAALVASAPAVVLLVIGNDQRAQVSWIELVTWDSVQGLPQNVFLSGAVGGLVLALALVGAGRGAPAQVAAAAGFVPPVLLVLVGLAMPVWVGRYVLVAVPALAALAGAGALATRELIGPAITTRTMSGLTITTRQPGRHGGLPAVAAVVVTALCAYPVQTELRTPDGHGQDSAQLAEVIGPRYEIGDVAVFPDTHESIAWSPRDIYERYLPDEPRPPDALALAGQRSEGQMLARECPDAACLGTPPRIWVIRADVTPDPLKDMGFEKYKYLVVNYRTVQTWRFRQLSVILMELRPPKIVKPPAKPRS